MSSTLKHVHVIFIPPWAEKKWFRFSKKNHRNKFNWFQEIHLWCIFIVIVTLHSANVKLLIWSIKHSTLAKLDNSNSTTFDLTPRIMQRVHLRDKCIISNANQIIFNTHTAPFPRTPTHPHCHTHEWSNYVPVCCALSEITHLSNLIRV